MFAESRSCGSWGAAAARRAAGAAPLRLGDGAQRPAPALQHHRFVKTNNGYPLIDSFDNVIKTYREPARNSVSRPSAGVGGASPPPAIAADAGRAAAAQERRLPPPAARRFRIAGDNRRRALQKTENAELGTQQLHAELLALPLSDLETARNALRLPSNTTGLLKLTTVIL